VIVLRGYPRAIVTQGYGNTGDTAPPGIVQETLLKHRDVLRLLFPLDLGGVHAEETEVDGANLDDAAASAATLLRESFPDVSSLFLADFERVLARAPKQDEPTQVRRRHILQKIRSVGGLSRQYFIDLAATLGWTITITEQSLFVWQVNVPPAQTTIPTHFTVGRSAVGEPLILYTPATELEEIFEDLKPAHTQVTFNYL
jgi:uncharacterized protein YmfQ (DUF2313 family)